jgi:DNA-binding NarL/FixJ family response regulator
MKRALVIDPDGHEQQRIRSILGGLWPQIDLVCASTIAAAHGYLGRCMPGLLMTDFYLPDGSGLELIEQVRMLYPASPRVLLTRHDDEAHLRAALRQGVDGYILKDQGNEGIRGLMAAVGKGDPGLSPEIMRLALRQLETPLADADPQGDIAPGDAESAGLTGREVEVLALLSQGMDRHRVGEALVIRPCTVAGHIKSIYLKLNVSTRAEATLAAVKLGLVDVEP